MHQASEYLTKHVYPGVRDFSGTHVLNVQQATYLKKWLIEDAKSLAHSSLISILEIGRGVEQELYSWSIVKSYYSTFYVLRSLLACRGRGVFYVGSKAFTIASNPGELPKRSKEINSHEAVLKHFADCYSSDWLLSQPILELSGPRWLKDLREEANYKRPRFCEPSCPQHFLQLRSLGFSKAVTAYLDKSNDYLAFDPDHASLAYPVVALSRLVFELRNSAGVEKVFDSSHEDWLRRKCRDQRAEIPALARLVSL